MNQEKNTISILLIILVFVGAYFLFFKKDTWLGFYYPNENDLTRHIQSTELDSLEACRAWVNTQVPIHNPSGYGYDYECGKNCNLQDYGLYVCKETLD